MQNKFIKENIWFYILGFLFIAALIIFLVFYPRSSKRNANSDLGTASSTEINTPLESSPAASSTPTEILPATTTIDVATTSSTGLANPASKNCADKGGNLQIKKDGSGGEYGLCFFDDNRACEEWALLRGDCPWGGRRTTGFDTEEQRYCAWLGGDTYAVENAVCKFKDGSSCLDKDLFKGLCRAGQNK